MIPADLLPLTAAQIRALSVADKRDVLAAVDRMAERERDQWFDALTMIRQPDGSKVFDGGRWTALLYEERE